MNILEYENYQEKKSHGSENFPYTTYLCSIPLDFTTVPAHWHEETEIIYIKADTCNRSYFLPLLDGSIQIPAHFTPQTPHYSDIAACIDGADEICRTTPDAYPLAIKGQLYLMFFTLFSKCTLKEKRQKDSKSLEKMKSIITYIEQNYMDKITIDDIAKELGLSQSHFMKFFKNTMGTTFTNYLNDYRLTLASRLLASSDSSILDIAAEAGFENLSYFNRLFKKRFGVTPREYRKVF